MYRFALVGLWTALAFAQNEPFKPKPPVEVDALAAGRGGRSFSRAPSVSWSSPIFSAVVTRPS